MLRSVSMHNFVHFTTPHSLKFEPGLNFIIGPNSSGKTALFEMIRRCLSKKINTTKSSVPDPTKIAYAVCAFQIKSDYKLNPHEKNTTVLKYDPSWVVSCVFVKTNQTGLEKNQSVHVYKVFCALHKSTWEIYIQRYDSRLNSLKQDFRNCLCCKKLDITEEDNFHEIIMSIIWKDTGHHDNIHRMFKEVESYTESGSPCEEVLIDNTFSWLTASFVGVFPMRSIGPLQWTRGIDSNLEERQNDYATACKRAQILMDLLSEEKEDFIDWKLEDTFHKHLVYPYKFVREQNMINVYDDSMPDNRPIPLLKAPDGIVEAKQLSLLLSEKSTSTLTLEEPERGMHPQMINKLRDWVLKKIHNKTILIISHHPAMLDHYTLGKVYLCSRSFKTGALSNEIQKIPGLDSYRKYGRVEEMKSLLFAERVLFVEGCTDQIYMEAIFDILINSTVNYDDVVSPEEGSVETEEFRKYLSSLQIVQLIEGCGAGPKKMDFCKQIHKESLIVYDSDVVMKNKKFDAEQIGIDFKSKEKTEIIKWSAEEISKFETACKEKNVFVWREGALENVIASAQHTEKTPNVKGSKKDVIHKTNAEICEIAKQMIQSEACKRFFQFLYEMMLKSSKEIPQKRKQQEDQKNQPKSKKKKGNKYELRSKQNTSDDSSSSETSSSDIPPEQHTGVSQDLMGMELSEDGS